MVYKVTQKVLDIVDALYDLGYNGKCAYTNSFAAGTRDALGNSFVLELSGFCKESLHLTEDQETGEIVAVGRYHMEGTVDSAEEVVRLAYRFYQKYKQREYSMPQEFVNAFIRLGLIVEKTVTKMVYEET